MRRFAPLRAIRAPQEGSGVVGDRHLSLSQNEFLALEPDAAALLVAERFHALRGLGCDAEAAVVVAVHVEISVSEAAHLIRSGCRPRTVLRVLR